MIKRISIKNFKGIKDTSLSMETINVLIGANGAGKSTLLEAINFSKRIMTGENISITAHSYAPFGTDFFNYYLPDSSTARFTIDIETREKHIYRYQFTIAYNSSPRIAEEFYVYSEKLSKCSEKKSENEEVVFDRKPSSKTVSFENKNGAASTIEIANNRLFLATLAHPVTQEIVDTVSSFNILWSDGRIDASRPGRYVVDNPTSTSTIDDIVVALSLKDKEAYNNAIKSITKIIPEFEKPQIINLLGDRLRRTTTPNQQKKEETVTDYRYFVNWIDTRHNGAMYSRCAISGGNSKVIYLILSLYNTDGKTCFIAEEIENGMHPARVKKLVQTIMSIAKERKIQLLFTTHSFQLMSELLPRQVIFCKYVDGEGAQYQRLTETDEYKDVKVALDTEPSTDDMLESGLLFGDD